MSGATDAAEEEDYTLLIGRSDRITQGSDTLRRLAGEGRVDGFVLQRSDDVSDQALESLVANDARFVLVTSRTPGRRGSVILDDVAGARLATEHLIALGHTRIALVGGIPSSDLSRRREQGYALALHEAGLRRRENLVRRLGHSPEMAAEAIESLAAGVPRPTAVVVANVNGAIGALTALRRLGIDVPEDMSVVAYHDEWVADHTWPPLTTVKMPYYEVGAQAVRSLVAQLRGSPAEDIVVDHPPPRLVPRSSTGPPPATPEPLKKRLLKRVRVLKWFEDARATFSCAPGQGTCRPVLPRRCVSDRGELDRWKTKFAKLAAWRRPRVPRSPRSADVIDAPPSAVGAPPIMWRTGRPCPRPALRPLSRWRTRPAPRG